MRTASSPSPALSTPCITIRRERQDAHHEWWVCDHTQAPDAAEVFALFGAYVIPTPFSTSYQTGEQVVDAIQYLNPDVRVVLG